MTSRARARVPAAARL